MDLYRRIGFIVAATVLGGYGTVALLGPQGFLSLRDRYQEIRRLERENADIERANRELETLIDKVRNSRSQQEVIVKERLRYTHSGELQFVLPDSTINLRNPAPRAKPYLLSPKIPSRSPAYICPLPSCN